MEVDDFEGVRTCVFSLFLAYQGIGEGAGEDPHEGLQDVGRDGEGRDAAHVDAEGLAPGGGVRGFGSSVAVVGVGVIGGWGAFQTLPTVL